MPAPAPTMEAQQQPPPSGGGGYGDPPSTPRVRSPQPLGGLLSRSGAASPPAATTQVAVLSSSPTTTTSYTYYRGGPNNGSTTTTTTTLEGYLLKRGSHLSSYVRWNDRYFILRPDRGTLSYYLRRCDVKPRGVVVLGEECTVSEVYMAERREKKNSAASTVGATAGVTAGAVSFADNGDEDSGSLIDNSSSSDREQQQVGVSELAARERQPVTKRLAYGGGGAGATPITGSKAGAGAPGVAGSKSATKTKKGREKLFCIKISWLRAGGGGGGNGNAMTASSSSPGKANAPLVEEGGDGMMPEIPNIASVASAARLSAEGGASPAASRTGCRQEPCSAQSPPQCRAPSAPS